MFLRIDRYGWHCHSGGSVRGGILFKIYVNIAKVELWQGLCWFWWLKHCAGCSIWITSAQNLQFFHIYLFFLLLRSGFNMRGLKQMENYEACAAVLWSVQCSPPCWNVPSTSPHRSCVRKLGIAAPLAPALWTYCFKHMIINKGSSDDRIKFLSTPLFSHLDYGGWTVRGCSSERL